MITESEVWRVVDLLPGNCFIRQYAHYAARQVSSHCIYHLGVGASLAGVTAPASLKLVGFKKDTYPNSFTLLVGSSGEAEKTLAVDVGQSLLASACPDVLASDPTADETLVKMLAARSTRLFVYPDYATFLSKTSGGDQRGEGLRTGFMSYFDGLSFSRQYSKGPPIIVNDPRPSLLAACTPQHLESYTVSLDWRGGFISRHLMLWGEKERDLPWPEPMPRERAWLLDYLAWSAGVGAAGPCLGVTPEGQRLWVAWLEDTKKRFAGKFTDENVKGLVSRSRLMAAKLSLLIAWSSGYCLGPWRLDAPVLEAAIAVADLHLKSALLLVRNIAPSLPMMEQKRVYHAIETTWTPLGDVLMRSHLTKKRATEYIETLVEHGVITPTAQNGVTYYRQTGAGTIPYDYQLEAAALNPPVPADMGVAPPLPQ